MALRGNLKDFSLPDVFQLVTFSKKTGVLRIKRADGAIGSVWFRDGEVFFAQSNWHGEPLGERLVHANRITPSALAKVLSVRKAEGEGGRRLGQILVDDGYITDKVLESFVQEQIQDTIFDLMRWDEGEFDFELLPEVVDEDIGLSVSIENVIMEGSRRLEEWARIKKKIPSMDIVFKMATAPGEGTFEISLKPIEWNLLLLVDGTRSVADLARTTNRTDFEVARIMYGLFSAGLLEVASDEEVERLRAERVEQDKIVAEIKARQAAEESQAAQEAQEREAALAAEAEARAAQEAELASLAELEAQPPVDSEPAQEQAAPFEHHEPSEVPEFLSGGTGAATDQDMAVFEAMMGAVLETPADARPESEPVLEVEDEFVAEKELAPELEARPELAPAPEPLLEPQFEPEPEPEPQPQLEIEPEPQPGFELEPQPGFMPESELAVGAELLPEGTIEFELETEPVGDSEIPQAPSFELEIGSDSAAEADLTVDFKAETDADSEVGPDLFPGLEPSPASDTSLLETDIEPGLTPDATVGADFGSLETPEEMPPAPASEFDESAASERTEPERTGDLAADLMALGLGELPTEDLLTPMGEPQPSDSYETVLEPDATAPPLPPYEELVESSVESDALADLAIELGLEPQGEEGEPDVSLQATTASDASTEVDSYASDVQEPVLEASDGSTGSEAPDFSDILESLDRADENESGDIDTFDAEIGAPPAEGVISTDAYLADIGGDNFGTGLSSGLGDELSALTGAGGSKRPTASVNRIPEPGATLELHRDQTVDRELVMKIIEGIKNL